MIDGLARIGWQIERPRGTMFVWASIPEPYTEMTSLEFATMCVQEAKVAVSPGSGFGPGGEGFIRFALVENEQRIQQAVRQLRKGLTKLGMLHAKTGGSQRLLANLGRRVAGT